MRAGGAGALSGALGYVDEGESRLDNALTEGTLSAVLGGLFQGVANAPGAVNGTFKKGPLEGIRALIMGKNPSLKEATKLYKSVASTLEGAGAESGIPSPNIDWNTLGKHIPKEGSKKIPGLNEIKKLVEKGTYQDLNQAQSKLSTVQRALESRATMGATNAEALNAAREAEKRIHGKLFERFVEIEPALASKYQKANELFAKGSKGDETFRKALGLTLKTTGIGGGGLYAIKKFSDLLEGK